MTEISPVNDSNWVNMREEKCGCVVLGHLTNSLRSQLTENVSINFLLSLS